MARSPTPADIQAALDAKAKPPGALGGLERLAARIAAVQGTLAPRADRARLTIFAGDHGIVAQGVSAWPQAVTSAMVAAFLSGGAAACVLARGVGADVRVVDAGIAHPVDRPGLILRRMGAGTADSAVGPAMSAETAARALAEGRALGADGDAQVEAFGEMGIGNTSAAALVAHKVTGVALEALVGRGAGLDDDGLARKARVLARAAARTPARLGAEAALAEYGGFEIAMMAGAMLGAAGAGRLVVVDGFIASAAAACALDLDPGAGRAMIWAHRSAEAGHGPLLDALGAEPLLDLGLRLGEGTGALLALPLLRAAADMLRDMATLEQITGEG